MLGCLRLLLSPIETVPALTLEASQGVASPP